jgi:hypothetical protein
MVLRVHNIAVGSDDKSEEPEWIRRAVEPLEDVTLPERAVICRFVAFRKPPIGWRFNRSSEVGGLRHAV